MTALFATGPDRPTLDDRATVDRLYRRNRLRVLIAITLGYGIAYTCRLALSVVKQPLIEGGIFTPVELGLIGSALFYTYAIGKLTNGFLSDHANMKVFFAFGLLMSALLNVGMGFSTVLTLSVVLWALNGWFQGFGAPAGIVTLANWYSNRERGRYYGIWSTAHSIGEGLTFVLVAGMVAAWGWRFGFWGPGLLCILVAIGVFALMQDRPRTLGLPEVNDWHNDHWQPVRQASTANIWKTQLSILALPSMWVLALASATNYVVRYAINSWGILYLQEVRGFSLVEAGTLLMVNTLAGIAGCIAFGFISDKVFNARRPPANLLFAIVEIVALYLIFFGPRNLAVLIFAFALYGIGLNGLVTSLGGLFGVDIAPKRAAGAVMGFIGVFSYVGAGIQENISGYLIQQGITMVDGERVYDFTSAIGFWMGAAVVSLLLAATLWRVQLRD
ncbi:MAG TPA: MFS transporter [Woeseiaceae bacterium]|nr:MFS transporter [Woeseiaceae bacterium]